MPLIHVCAVTRLAQVAELSGARDLISLVREHLDLARPPGIAPERHLRLSFNDIAEPREGLTLVQQDHVAHLIDFVQRWDRQAPLLIHCFAGVSRSTAAAFVAACVLHPQVSEAHWAARLRAASPTASPNTRLVALADGLLARQGRMMEAVAGIGRGAPCEVGEPFVLDVREAGA